MDNLKLYVFDNVLKDYTDGMAIVVARSKKEAIDKLINKIYIPSDKQSDKKFIETYKYRRNEFEQGACSIYHNLDEKIIHYVYGGG